MRDAISTGIWGSIIEFMFYFIKNLINYVSCIRLGLLGMIYFYSEHKGKFTVDDARVGVEDTGFQQVGMELHTSWGAKNSSHQKQKPDSQTGQLQLCERGEEWREIKMEV